LIGSNARFEFMKPVLNTFSLGFYARVHCRRVAPTCVSKRQTCRFKIYLLLEGQNLAVVRVEQATEFNIRAAEWRRNTSKATHIRNVRFSTDLPNQQ
jgi:hypothetical protein